MTNPETVMGRTPNGGDFSELYYLDRRGDLAKTMDDVTELRILEKTNDGKLVNTTYSVFDRRPR